MAYMYIYNYIYINAQKEYRKRVMHAPTASTYNLGAQCSPF